jgi:hypothetical protein
LHYINFTELINTYLQTLYKYKFVQKAVQNLRCAASNILYCSVKLNYEKMKKIIAAGALVLGTLSMFACERQNENTTDKEGEESVVVDRDSVATEYEVTETVVDYDTTTRTKTVDSEVDRDNDKDNDRKD